MRRGKPGHGGGECRRRRGCGRQHCGNLRNNKPPAAAIRCHVRARRHDERQDSEIGHCSKQPPSALTHGREAPGRLQVLRKAFDELIGVHRPRRSSSVLRRRPSPVSGHLERPTLAPDEAAACFNDSSCSFNSSMACRWPAGSDRTACRSVYVAGGVLIGIRRGLRKGYIRSSTRTSRAVVRAYRRAPSASRFRTMASSHGMNGRAGSYVAYGMQGKQDVLHEIPTPRIRRTAAAGDDPPDARRERAQQVECTAASPPELRSSACRADRLTE
jgi:hypothetical protein